MKPSVLLGHVICKQMLKRIYSLVLGQKTKWHKQINKNNERSSGSRAMRSFDGVGLKNRMEFKKKEKKICETDSDILAISRW